MASLLLAMVGTVVCLQVYLLTRRLAGPLPAIAALAIAAISPLQIASCVQILSEGWFTCWVLASLLTLEPLLRSQQTDRKRHLLLRALIAGLATGARNPCSPRLDSLASLRCLPAVAVPPRSAKPANTAGRHTVPWFMARAAALGRTQLSGQWPVGAHLTVVRPQPLRRPESAGDSASDMRFLDEESLYTRFSEAEVNDQYKQRAVDFVLENPGRTTVLAFIKSARFLSPILSGGLANPALNTCLATWYLILTLLTAYGLLSGRLSVVATLLLFLPFLQFLLVHMVFVGSVRYRLPVEMPLTAVAACGMVGMWQRRSGRWHS